MIVGWNFLTWGRRGRNHGIYMSELYLATCLIFFLWKICSFIMLGLVCGCLWFVCAEFVVDTEAKQERFILVRRGVAVH
jgi:hypothetical protein